MNNMAKWISKNLNPKKPESQSNDSLSASDILDTPNPTDVSSKDVTLPEIEIKDPITILKEEEGFQETQASKVRSRPPLTGSVMDILAERARAAGTSTPGINKVSEIIRQRATGAKEPKTPSQVIASRKLDPRNN